MNVHLVVWCAQGSKDALYNVYGVSHNNVYDLQLPESANNRLANIAGSESTRCAASLNSASFSGHQTPTACVYMCITSKRHEFIGLTMGD